MTFFSFKPDPNSAFVLDHHCIINEALRKKLQISKLESRSLLSQDWFFMEVMFDLKTVENFL